MSAPHLPVMLEEVVALLDPRPGGCYVDATVGAGGHAAAIAKRIGPRGALVGLDRDPQMLRLASERLGPYADRVRLVHARFSFLREVAEGCALPPVDGILLDLGVASVHLDEPQRGFSFRTSAPLDMRLDPTQGETAAQRLARLEPDELAQLLRRGGVPAPRAVAQALARHRPIETTAQLVEALRGLRLPRRHHHPATLVFQALRIAVNDEYAELEAGLEAAVELLAPGGRLAVLSYHSGEDQRVKRHLAAEARGCICPPDLPVCGCGRRVRLKLLARGEGPSAAEQARNPRARSARLRGAERC
jgi:16S rRNA (cytosine1402-N4)-methyltransferase